MTELLADRLPSCVTRFIGREPYIAELEAFRVGGHEKINIFALQAIVAQRLLNVLWVVHRQENPARPAILVAIAFDRHAHRPTAPPGYGRGSGAGSHLLPDRVHRALRTSHPPLLKPSR